MGMSFRDLNIWKKGYTLALRVYQVSSSFPADERHGLTNQVRRSANSVIANIAESFGRFHYADRGLGYIRETDFVFLDKEYEGLGVGINAYISSLKT